MSQPNPVITRAASERGTRGLTVRAAARRAGIHHTSVRFWENGHGSPTLDVLDLYLEALGLRLEVVPIEAEEADPGEQIPYDDMVIAPGEKWCLGCSQIRAVRDFHLDRSTRDGRHRRCKHCRRASRLRRLREAAA